MLVRPFDYEWTSDYGLFPILETLSKGSNLVAEVVPGCYLIAHHNFRHLLDRSAILSEYTELPSKGEDCLNCYGVCDSVEQFLEVYKDALAEPHRRFVVGFTCVRKADEPPDGGWRWHKWGPYIGKQKVSGCEYLYDEPNVEQVYCFSIIELYPDHIELAKQKRLMGFRPRNALRGRDEESLNTWLQSHPTASKSQSTWWFRSPTIDSVDWQCFDVLEAFNSAKILTAG